MCTLEMTYGPNLIRCRFRKEKLPDGSELFAMEHPRKCFSFFLFLILKFSFFFFFIEKTVHLYYNKERCEFHLDVRTLMLLDWAAYVITKRS
jgi:hypothetical protein